jgi:activating signal cointegrator 1
MADGRKAVETRSWRAPKYLIGKRLAIHAAKSIDREACQAFGYDLLKIPRGAILCHVRLDACLPTPCSPEAIKFVWGHLFSPIELKCGNFEDGRFAWLCSDLQRVDPPVPAVGHLSIWNCFIDVPEVRA